MGYLFGPVLSRRLGLSMGVDLLKYKTCNLDCVYCELGRTACLTSCRDRFVPRQKVLKEIELRRGEPFDHLTFAGSGEPTLSLDLGEIVAQAKKIVDSPVAVITNSTLLSNPAVRKEVAAADVVLPSLDAASQKAFQAINRPASGLYAKDMIQGLKDFRKEFSGEIWLEVMLVRGINDQEAELIAQGGRVYPAGQNSAQHGGPAAGGARGGFERGGDAKDAGDLSRRRVDTGLGLERSRPYPRQADRSSLWQALHPGGDKPPPGNRRKRCHQVLQDHGEGQPDI